MRLLPKSRIGRATAVFCGALVLLAIAFGGYHEASRENFCLHCHEMGPVVDIWKGSTHREIPCKDCHGGILTLDAGFHTTNLERLSSHLRGEIPERLLIRDGNVDGLQERCRSCHREEFADWESSPHGTSYAKVFLNETHNKAEFLMDDCLRCHGMYFDGAIRDLVQPIDRKGPWRLARPEDGSRPAIPCLGCHRIHGPGEPLGGLLASADRPKGAAEEIHRPSLSFFDRRARRNVDAAALPIPAMLDGDRPVLMSPDRRQATCYQCHAPRAEFRVASGDDRTPTGVHEGLSCLACHAQHSQRTRASCAACHPRLSNCNLDVETMDTTYRSKESKHNVHWVKCQDCHPAGPPPKKKA